MSHTKMYASVWDAIADTPEQAANLRARAELMRKITAIVKENKWTQTEAAARCGVTQPRMNDLLRGRVSRFSLDALFNLATALGRRVRVEIELSPRRGVPRKRKIGHALQRRNAASR
jgi:predicted XRE-type DNA-binding protein